MISPKPKVLVIVGPTASGKTELARRLAIELNGEVISADSRQVYTGMDIGTGKDKSFQQWLIDIAEPNENFTVADYQKNAYQVVSDILSRKKLPILCGGTGLYISAVTEGYHFSQRKRNAVNPRHAAATAEDEATQKNPPNWDVLEIAVDLPREVLYQRIDDRVLARLDQGMVEEAEKLVQSGVSLERLRQFGLEYRFLADLLEDKMSKEQFIRQLQQAIHQYARRQMTWFRHHGNVHWIKDDVEARTLIDPWLSK